MTIGGRVTAVPLDVRSEHSLSNGSTYQLYNVDRNAVIELTEQPTGEVVTAATPFVPIDPGGTATLWPIAGETIWLRGPVNGSASYRIGDVK